MEFVELGDGGFESQLAAGDLQALDEISRAGEQDAPAPVDEGEAKSRRQVAFSAAGRPEQQQIGALVKPGVAGGKRHDLGLADHGHGLEVKGVEGLAGREPGFGKMAFEAAPSTLGNLMFGQSGQKAAAGQPSLSAWTASAAQTGLTAGRRNSARRSSMRAASPGSSVLMRRRPTGRC